MLKPIAYLESAWLTVYCNLLVPDRREVVYVEFSVERKGETGLSSSLFAVDKKGRY
jgi:hypothetical protein